MTKKYTSESITTIARVINKQVNEMENIYGPLNTSIGVFNFMINQKSPYWTKHEFRGKTYIMTFEYNIYECKESK